MYVGFHQCALLRNVRFCTTLHPLNLYVTFAYFLHIATAYSEINTGTPHIFHYIHMPPMVPTCLPWYQLTRISRHHLTCGHHSTLHVDTTPSHLWTPPHLLKSSFIWLHLATKQMYGTVYEKIALRLYILLLL